MKNLLISFSGGETSALMAILLLNMPTYLDYNKVVVYANTGKENEQTLQFIQKCDKHFNLNVIWLEAKVNFEKGVGTDYNIVDFEIADRKGRVFEDVIKKYGLPSKLYRHCTREMKQVPIKKFAKKHFKNEKFEEAIGIRFDEQNRVGSKFYPLNDLKITKEMVNAFWKQQPFRLELKDYQGNCDLCFLKSKRKKLTILSEDPTKAEFWREMERKYTSQYQSQFDVINNLSINELIEASKQPFRKSIDSRNEQQLFEPELDFEHSCFCSNT